MRFSVYLQTELCSPCVGVVNTKDYLAFASQSPITGKTNPHMHVYINFVPTQPTIKYLRECNHSLGMQTN